MSTVNSGYSWMTSPACAAYLGPMCSSMISPSSPALRHKARTPGSAKLSK